MTVSLKRFRCFVALAEEGHFGRAAERVFLSQPALSKQIAQLEADLDAELFERTPQGVSLTEAGRVLLPEARLVLEQIGRALRSVQELSDLKASRLRLGAVGPAAHNFLPKIVQVMRATHPDLVISLREVTTAEQLELLKRDQIDLAILCADDTDEVAFTPMFKDPVVVGLQGANPLARYANIPIERLSEQTLASPRRVEPGHARLLSFLEERGVHPEVIDIDSVATTFGLISVGEAVGLFPAFAQDKPPPDVTFRPTEPALPDLETGVAWRRNSPPAILEPFLEAAKQVATSVRPVGSA